MICGRPLAFGDVEQIAVVNSLRAKEEEKVLREKRIAAGELVEFEVDLKVEGTVTVNVEASSKEEAMRLAREEHIDLMDIDVDKVDVEHCREV
jgi:hypothetical protein